MSGPLVCPNCRTGNMTIFHTVNSVPTNSCIQLPTREEAKNYPRGRIELGFCSECGFISNVAFDETSTEYSSRYEETQGFSPTFRAYHKELAERLVKQYGLNDKDIIEIGCGKGEFLSLICKLGGNRGIGFDPGYIQDRGDIQYMDNVQVIQDFYSEKYTHHKGDFVCCKMTLEHIPATADFIANVRHSVDRERGCILFFQIPETTRIIRDCAFEDIYYEHCSYFYPGSIARLFGDSGFEILTIGTEYDDQYLTIEAKAGNRITRPVPLRHNLESMKKYVAAFPDRCRQKLRYWQDILDESKAKHQKVVLWGSGSKGVSFLTSLDTDDVIEYVVDINPHRAGCYMSGTGQEIVGPEFLKDYKPDLVIAMNRVYHDEIRRDLADIGLEPRLLAL